jgi:hypothetical protein
LLSSATGAPADVVKMVLLIANLRFMCLGKVLTLPSYVRQRTEILKINY